MLYKVEFYIQPNYQSSVRINQCHFQTWKVWEIQLCREDNQCGQKQFRMLWEKLPDAADVIPEENEQLERDLGIWQRIWDWITNKYIFWKSSKNNEITNTTETGKVALVKNIFQN